LIQIKLLNMAVKKKNAKKKGQLHRRNRHQGRYDLESLATSYPLLKDYMITNKYGDESIDFFDPIAVKALNAALLHHFYDLNYWDIPHQYLCPPIPGRADYIHYMADLLAKKNGGEIPKGKMICCLDIGVGANCIYPIIGSHEYQWSFIGSDIDEQSIASAKNIVDQNERLQGFVDLRLQSNSNQLFKGVLKEDDKIDLVMCNPPFHSSMEEAEAASQQKNKNLKKEKIGGLNLNFGGQSNELWCEGGEEAFIKRMIEESQDYSQQCFVFSTLVSKSKRLESVYRALEGVDALKVKTTAIGQGNKKSRIVSWTFLTENQQEEWVKNRWQ